MRILGTGLRGLVGSRIVELLKDRYEFEISDIDITDRQKIIDKIKGSDASVILHLAAKTNVDGCELDKPLGKEGEAWKINVEGTKNMVEACRETNKKLIYISTDFVFDGTNPPAGGYQEEDTPNPLNWYAKTKYEGEKIVQTLKSFWIIVRIAYPYRAQFERLDFARAILKRLQDGLPVAAVKDHIFTPTFIDDIALAIDTLIKNNSQGILHCVGSQSLTPFDASVLIAKEFDLDMSKISGTTRAEFFNNRAPRSFQLALKNDKITRLGVRMRTFEEGLREIKSQLSS